MAHIGDSFFYHNLKADSQLNNFANLSSYHDLPEDWIVIITDIEGSTKAIEAGRYKAVNTLGASAIAAVLNTNRDVNIPFIFGGDGATFAIPRSMLKPVRAALLGTKALAKEFKLELRIGMATVSEFKLKGYQFLIKKIHVSDFVSQASFAGNGWDAVEGCIKNKNTRRTYELTRRQNEPVSANFEGLECKWEGIKIPNKHKLSVIVADTSSKDGTQIRHFLQKINEIYGSLEDCHPLQKQSMHLNTSPKKLENEIKVRTLGASILEQLIYTIKTCLRAFIGEYILFRFGIKTEGVDGKEYVNELISNADVMKYDGMLKMIISSTDENSNLLIDYLVKQYRDNKLVFGVHRSEAAILTCLVFSLKGNHFHFVDGSDGGYAMAAKQLKEQLANNKAVKESVIKLKKTVGE